MKRIVSSIIFGLILLCWGRTPAPAAAAPAVVHCVLFYSSACPHCHEAMEETLPPIKARYQEQLEIVGIEIQHPLGESLYQAMVEKFHLGDNRLGVPALVVGDQVFVGVEEIAQQFPQAIETGLANGGVDWPSIPGLDAVLAAQTEAAPVTSLEMGPADTRPLFVQNFFKDRAANSLAVVVLLLMVGLVIYVLARFLAGRTDRLLHWPDWIIPALAIFGLFVAGYLSYIEITQSRAICGPVGNCNSVQASPYARLFGFLPVGVLGMIGYIAILAAWLLKKFGPFSLHKHAILALWAFAWFGILFSIYLTFLEPFVIGATCAWCLTSALIMCLAFLATSGPAIQALHVADDNEDELLEDSAASAL